MVTLVGKYLIKLILNLPYYQANFKSLFDSLLAEDSNLRMNPIATESLLNVPELIITLLGGLAFFLFGMMQMTDALKAAAGEKIRLVLGKLTTNRFTAVFSGAFITTVVQSSSVTTVLLVGLVSAGLMTLPQSIGVIMGANIGTTVTAQIIAFKITKYALLILSLGFFMSFISKNSRLKQCGEIIMGIGVIFFGMSLMGDATEPLRTFAPAITIMSQMENPWLGLVAGMIFTIVVQSSSATTGLIIVLAGQGVITLDAGIAMAFGANVGTCVTALLAALGKPREALQVSVTHVLFNIIGVIIWIGFIDQLADIVRSFSPSFPDLTATDRLARETPRQIANAHTLFNLVNVLLFIGFVGPFARLVNWLIPINPVAEGIKIKPKYIDKLYLQTPSLALSQVCLEVGRLGECVVKLLKASLPAVMQGAKEDIEAIVQMDDAETLYLAIIDYLRQVGSKDLTPQETNRMKEWLEVATYLESISDLVRTNFVTCGSERLEKNVSFSKPTRRIILPLYEAVLDATELALEALLTDDVELACRVVAIKPRIQKLADKATSHVGRRLLTEEPDRTTLYRIESETVNQIKRLYYYAKRIAKVIATSKNVPITEKFE